MEGVRPNGCHHSPQHLETALRDTPHYFDLKKKETHLDHFVHPSISRSPCFFLHVPESTEGTPQGGVLVTIFPACTAANQAAAVTAEESDYRALVFTRPPHFSQTRQDALIYSVLQVSN